MAPSGRQFVRQTQYHSFPLDFSPEPAFYCKAQKSPYNVLNGATLLNIFADQWKTENIIFIIRHFLSDCKRKKQRISYNLYKLKLDCYLFPYTYLSLAASTLTIKLSVHTHQQNPPTFIGIK